MPINRTRGQGARASTAACKGQTLFGCQQGGFSPFLFGLVMGMSIFSALSLQWAKQALADYEQQQIARSKANAEDVAKGLNFAILTEDTQTYSDKYDLERARSFTNTDARTQGQQDYMVTAREDDTRTQYGKKATTVAVTGSDDTLLRSQMYRTDSAEQILKTKNTPGQAVAVYDTSIARDRQVRTSNERMEILAEQLYAFYAGRFRFPTDSEYIQLNSTFNLHDAWGNAFTYKQEKSGQKATLSFTTPWNYTQLLNLALKDEQNTAEYPQNNESKNPNVSPTTASPNE